MSDKIIQSMGDALTGGPWNGCKSFRQWLHFFLTRHGLKPRDTYLYKIPHPGGQEEQVVIQAETIVEVLLCTSAELHPQIKLLLEMKEKEKADVKDWIGQMGLHFFMSGYFNRDPNFKQVQIEVPNAKVAN
jgi:hypothetical protein